jgi:mannose-6-phosphate isomerase
MATLSGPLLFEPYLRPMVWGGRALGEQLGKELPTADRYGESWEVSDHPHHRSRLTLHERNTTLRDLMQRHRTDLLGPRSELVTFPWLCKFLDAGDWLSVQVHPDEKTVATLWPGENSKTEAWFVLAAQPESRIYAGLLPGIGPKELRDALEEGTVADCLSSFTPRAGDCVFLPAGTVHALGGGVLLAEIQQTSDATFRLFDWNRRDAQGKSRPLHIEQSLAAIHWDQGPVSPVQAEGYAGPSAVPRQAPVAQALVRCRYFHVDYAAWKERAPLGGNGKLQAAVIVSGRGRWSNGQAVTTGQVWVLPAAMPPTWCEPDGTLAAMVCTLP